MRRVERAGLLGWSVESAASEVIGTTMMLGIAVVVGGSFTLLLLALPPPVASSQADLGAFVAPVSSDVLVVEHRGGLDIALSRLVLVVGINGSENRSVVGDKLAAGDTAWTVVSASNRSKTASDALAPGDQVRFRDNGVSSGAVTVQVLETGSGTLLLPLTRVRDTDASAPAIRSARTTSTTAVEVNVGEALANASAFDFTVSGASVQSQSLLGNGSKIEVRISALAPSATPTVCSVASPAGTWDIAGNALQGSVCVAATDGVPPNVTSGPSPVVINSESVYITWTTDEASDSFVEYGPTPQLGSTASNATLVTNHTVTLTNLAELTVYHYRIKSKDAAGNTVSSETKSFVTSAVSTGPTLPTDPFMNLIYVPEQEEDNPGVLIGLNIVNPTPDAIVVDKVQITAMPPLSAGAFFREVIVASGSDTAFKGCTLTGNNSNTIICDLTNFTIGSFDLTQVVFSFRTASTITDGATKLLGSALLTTPASNITTGDWDVKHRGQGFQNGLMAQDGAGTDARAAFSNATQGQPKSFYLKQTDVVNNGDTHSRIIIPAGWTNLSVPTQTNSAALTITILHPTLTSQGRIDITQSDATREFYFNATPPARAGPGILTIEWSLFESGGNSAAPQRAYLNFGVIVK